MRFKMRDRVLVNTPQGVIVGEVRTIAYDSPMRYGVLPQGGDRLIHDLTADRMQPAVELCA